jgi:hypothetical protein
MIDAPVTNNGKVSRRAVSLARGVSYVAAHGPFFGGPAGQIAVMHRILVEEKRWYIRGAVSACA